MYTHSAKQFSCRARAVAAGFLWVVLAASSTCGQDVSFLAARQYTAGSRPSSVAVGDFNGDGLPDLAVANEVSNNVSVVLGNGDGTFQAAVNYAAGSGPLSVAVGDFNGDGVQDLAVTNASGVSVLLGHGDGTFQAAVNYAGGSSPNSVAVDDFNGDGKPDLAVADGGGGVSILINTTPIVARRLLNFASKY